MKSMDIYKCSRALMAMAVLGLAMTSCNDEVEPDVEQYGEVAFSAGLQRAVSRTTESEWDGDEQIAVKSGETVKTYTVDVDGVMTTADAPFTWEGEPYEVTAWTPYTSGEIDLTNQTTDELLFCCDLLASSATVESTKVRFSFVHRMTRMWWELQIDAAASGYTDDEINAARVTFLGYGAATFNEGTVTPVGNPDQTINTCIRRSEYYWDGEAMMVPCDMWEKPLIKVEIGGNSYTYTPTRNDANDVAKRTGDLLPGTWQRYYLKVTKEGLKVDMVSGPSWEEGETGEVKDALFKAVIPDEISELTDYEATGFESGSTFITNANDGFSITYTENIPSGGIEFEGLCDRERTVSGGKVTFKFTNIRSDISLIRTTEYVEVGYYLNNDGSYGANYDAGKAVGVVFKVGMHETDNVADYGDKLPKIHGYAVALTDETGGNGGKYKWKDGTVTLAGSESPENALDGNTSKYIGYLQTQYLLKQDESGDGSMPAAQASKTKNENSAVNGTSGWYLPSHTQLKDLSVMAGKTITGYTALNGDYWDSSFDGTGGNAYYATFTDGVDTSVGFWKAADQELNVRLIITF